MSTIRDFLGLFGNKWEANKLVAVFRATLDESGTDGRSPYTVVAGAVATTEQWEVLEKAWDQLLKSRKLRSFHFKEFKGRTGDFRNWSDLKSNNFEKAIERIVIRNTGFRISVGIESAVHTDIKKRMKGIKGFSPESDYSLCLRYLMFHTCEKLEKYDKDCRLAILVESGPFAAGAAKTYERVAAMTGKWKPAKHAHRLAGFLSAPKGEFLALETADYLVGQEHARMRAERQPRAQTLSLLLTGPRLEYWYEGMLREKEYRRVHHKKTFRKPDS